MQIPEPSISAKKLPRPVIFFFTIDCFFSFAYLLTSLTPFSYFGSAEYWDLDSEAGIATWYSMLKFLSISIISALFVYRKVAEGQSSPVLFGLPIIFLAMGVDEVAQIHERIGLYSDIWLPAGNRDNTPFHETGIWMFLVGIPFLTFFLLWVSKLQAALTEHSSEIRMLLTGVLLLLLGALGLESLYNFLYSPLAQMIAITLEEGLEMLGATIVFWAVLNMSNKPLSYKPANSFQL